MTRIKICCIKNLEEAKLALKYAVSALGFVSEMPSGPGVISEDEIEKIVGSLPPFIASNLLTCKTDFDSISKQLLKCKTNTVQIVDKVEFDIYRKLRKNFPSIKIIQVVHVQDQESVEEAIAVSKYVDGILLDSGNRSLEVKVLGGTGKVHDWKISRKIRDSINIPLILAGGLNSENVSAAIEAVRPFAVDVCSGVRTNDKLDEEKLIGFVKKVDNEK
jgi:phosphoribosylanthranilate isomerase